MFKNINQILKSRAHRVLSALQHYHKSADISKFNSCGVGLSFESPRKLLNPQCISLGNHVKLGPCCQVAAITGYPGPWLRLPYEDIDLQRFEPTIRIGNRVTATSGLCIFAQKKVVIEDGVSFGPNVFINDASHGHESVDMPFIWQPLQGVAEVTIGKGCWISANVVIMPGVNIGKQTIIGANSVVTGSIPPYCIAVGAPAKVIKKWNFELQSWESIAHTSSRIEHSLLS